MSPRTLSYQDYGMADTGLGKNVGPVPQLNFAEEKEDHIVESSMTMTSRSRKTSNGTVNDNDSVMTGNTFMVMTKPDGTRGCMKHPHLILTGYTCHECEREFSQGNAALQQKKESLNYQLNQVEQQQTQQQGVDPQPPSASLVPPPMQYMGTSSFFPPQSQSGPVNPMGSVNPLGAMNPMSTMNPMGTMNPMEMNAMLGGGSMPGAGGGASKESDWRLETMAFQVNRLQQMQDWMLLQRERELQMMRQAVQELQEKLHASKLENAVLQERLGVMERTAKDKNGRVEKNNSYNSNNSSNNKSAKRDKDKAKKINHPSTENIENSNPSLFSQQPSIMEQSTKLSQPREKSKNGGIKAPPVTSAEKGSPKQNLASSTSKKNRRAPGESSPNNSSDKKSPPVVRSGEGAGAAGRVSSGIADRQQNQEPQHFGESAMFEGGAGGVPTNIRVDDSALPAVPLYEDITLATARGSAVKTSKADLRKAASDRFEPKYIGSPVDGQNMDINEEENPFNDHEGQNAADMNENQSLTVASSTYGEDRQRVVNKRLHDPYGDPGTFSGVILKSTGLPHGSGKMVYDEDQRVYEGEWRHGRWHGFGRASFANGDTYEGQYRFDQRHGRGKYCWNDGREFDGMFSEDKRHGKGTFLWPDGAIYDGEFANGNREGHGSYKFSDGGQYIGSWKDGRYTGFGTCTWEDGRCYRGEWRNGMAHGKGVEKYADGSIRHDGQWVDDEPVR